MYMDRDQLLDALQRQGNQLYDQFVALSDLSLETLDAARTALIVVDVIEGFAHAGAMASPRVAALVDPVADTIRRCGAAGMQVVTVADTHTPDSVELQTYPSHCLRGTDEPHLCASVAAAAATLPPDRYTHIDKNSTNAFVDPAFTHWREAHPACDTYVVVGDCTDICVMHFALTAKTWHNAHDRPLRVLIPLSLVDTYDAPGHPAAAANAMALWFMQSNGVEMFRGLAAQED